MTTRLLFAGTPEVAVPSLKAFAADPRFEVVAVLTRPDAPTGRGRRLVPSPVKAAALELGIQVIDAKPRDPGFLDLLAKFQADIAAVIAYGNILPVPVLDAVPMGWWNLHFSNLPRWRGAAPAQCAIWTGDATSGADVFKVGEGLDDGPIVASMSVELTGRETSGELLDRLAIEGAPMYVDALASVVDSTATLTPQPDEGAVYAHKITVEDARIDWSADVETIDRQIRACTPNPGAWSRLHIDAAEQSEGHSETSFAGTARDDAPGAQANPGLLLHVLAARPADTSAPNVPTDLASGELRAGKRNVWVGTGVPGHPLELLEVKAQGKKAMRAPDWARGARLNPGSHLG